MSTTIDRPAVRIRNTPPPQQRNVVAGVVVLLILCLVPLTFVLWKTMKGGGPETTYVAYFPGQTTINKGTRVVFGRDGVGSVAEVVGSQPGLQLTIVPVLVPSVPEVATLLPGSHATLTIDRDHPEIALASATRAVIRWSTDGTSAADSITAVRDTSGTWSLAAYGRALPVTLDGQPIVAGSTGRQPSLSPGDCLVFGAGQQALRVCWGDVDYLTRVNVVVRQGTFAKAAKNAGDSTGTIGPGTSVALLSGFGHPRPELELRPSLYHGDARVTVSPRPPRSDGKPVEPYELTAVASADPLALLSSLASYLGTPAALRQPPSNHAERIIAQADLLTTNGAELVRQLNQAGKGEQTGVLLRLALDEQQARSVSALLANLQTVSGHAGALAATANTDLSDPAARGELLRQLLGNGYDPLVSTLRNTAALTAHGNRLAAGLVRDTAVIDSTLHRVNRVTGVLASNGTRIDSTLRNVEAITTGVRSTGPKIDTALARAGRTARKAKRPVLVAIGTWFGMVIGNLIKR